PKPHVDLRIFTEVYASRINAKLILSDTLLRFETIARTPNDGFVPFYPLSYRINFSGKTEIFWREPVRITRAKFKVLMDKSLEEIQYAISKKKSVFIFSLRKGLA